MSAKCDYFPETTPQSTLTQGVRTSPSELGEGTVLSIAVSFFCVSVADEDSTFSWLLAYSPALRLLSVERAAGCQETKLVHRGCWAGPQLVLGTPFSWEQCRQEMVI